MSPLRALEEPYRARAIAPGSRRFASWLFAAREARAPLLGMYALAAEWRALMDPATEVGVARLKLAWWREELDRLLAGAPLHPITRWLADLEGGASLDLEPLQRSIEAAAAQVAGAPLEHAADLAGHAADLYGGPLLAAARLAGVPAAGSVVTSIHALATALYLTDLVSDYRRDARAGRVPFAVDELLAAGIDNHALCAAQAPPALARYLGALRSRAREHYSTAARTLGALERPPLRHLAVLSALGLRQLDRPTQRVALSLTDLVAAWNAARRSAGARPND